MTVYEKKRNLKFAVTVEDNDCAEVGEHHRWEVIGSSAQACVHCTKTRPMRVIRW